MTMKKLVTLAVGAVAIAGAAAAAGFAEIDENGDGLITKEEFAAAYPDANEDAWIAADVNGDGGLTEDELQAAMDSGVLPEG